MELVREYFGSTVRFHSSDRQLIHMMDFANVLYLPKNSRDVNSLVWKEYRFLTPDGVGKPSWFVNEYGAHQMIFAAQEERATKIQRWVFEEVLPAIRRDGGYITPDATRDQLVNLQDQIANQLAALDSAFTACETLNDQRGMITIKDQLQNLTDRINGKPISELDGWLSVSEILERKGYKVTDKDVKKSLGMVGKAVRKAYETETGLIVKSTPKHVGSGQHCNDIKVYPPDWFDKIEQIAIGYWATKNIKATE